MMQRAVIQQKISTFMLYGVFIYHGLIEVCQERPFRYMVTPLGKQNV